jgi:hypothetical protein
MLFSSFVAFAGSPTKGTKLTPYNHSTECLFFGNFKGFNLFINGYLFFNLSTF